MSTQIDWKLKDFTGNNYNAIDCLESDEGNEYNTDMTNLIKFIEHKYSCNGLCKRLPFYTYSDVTDGPPSDRCLEYLVYDEFFSKRDLYGSLLLLCGSLSFIAFFFQFGLCCRNKERAKIDAYKKENYEEYE